MKTKNDLSAEMLRTVKKERNVIKMTLMTKMRKMTLTVEKRGHQGIMTIQIQGKSENVHLLSKKMRTRLRTKKMQTLTKKMQTLTKKIPLIGELISARKEAKSTTHLYQKSKCPQFNNLSTSRQPRLISLLERVKKCEHFSV